MQRSEDKAIDGATLEVEEVGSEHEDVQSEEELIAERLDALGMSLARSRSEAITDRENQGIENEWIEDEEHYEGIDDANRGEMTAWRGKPMGQAGLMDEDADEGTGSTVFLNITRTYCDAAAARIGDMLLPTDDKGWSIGPTPLPDLVSISEGNIPASVDAQIANSPDVMANQDPAAEGERIKQELVDQVSAEIKEATEKAKKAEKRIEDWHVESKYNAENRKVLEDSARIGTGVLKGPIPEMVKTVAFVDNALVVKEEIVPVSRKIDPWNCFPDLACGDNVHNGAYHWERDEITRPELQKLMEQPGYLPSQIQKCLVEGPQHSAKEYNPEDKGGSSAGSRREAKRLFEIWYGYVTIEKEDLLAAGWSPEDQEPDDMDDEYAGIEGELACGGCGECEECDSIDLTTEDEGGYSESAEMCDDDDIYIPAKVTMVNNHVIHADMNVLSSGEFPYDYMVWQKRIGMPWGKGVSRQVRAPQLIINGAGRNLMDNAGLAGGPMWIYLQGLVEPIDGIHEIKPRKGWYASEDAEIDDVRKAFSYIKMDMMQNELTGIIQWAMKLAEDVSGMPMLMQGQNGPSVPDTVGVTQMLNNNAGTVLRRLARLYDDKITNPHTRRYYNYLLEYGDDEEKGDFVIEATGSAALVERDIQNQSIAQMGQLVQNPVYGIDPKKWYAEYLKSQRLDPAMFEFDDEEWKAVVEQMMSPPPQPQVEVANIRSQTELQKADMVANKDLQIAQMNAGEKSAERETKYSDKEKDRQIKLAIDQMQIQMDAADKDVMTTLEYDKLKQKFAELIATLQVQVGMGDTSPANPVVEPAGRAEDGKSFQQ